MADRKDEVNLPLPPTSPPLETPQILPPGAPSPSPDFRSRQVDASDAPPSEPPYEDASRRMPHGPPPPPTWPRITMFAITAVVITLMGLLGFILLGTSSPQAAQGSTGTEQTIELPPGQRLIHAEIGQHGEVFYRYAPLQPGEQPRSSTLEGRSNTGAPLGTIHFIERAAE